jgi:hypothetical protein
MGVEVVVRKTWKKHWGFGGLRLWNVQCGYVEEVIIEVLPSHFGNTHIHNELRPP